MPQSEPTRVILEITEGGPLRYNWAEYRRRVSQTMECAPESLIQEGTVTKHSLNKFLGWYIEDDVNLLVKWKDEIACWSWHFQDALNNHCDTPDMEGITISEFFRNQVLDRDETASSSSYSPDGSDFGEALDDLNWTDSDTE